MDGIAVALLLIFPVGAFVAYRLLEATASHPFGPDFLAVAAFREAASAVAGLVYVVIGVHVLMGRTLYPQEFGVVLLVAGVLMDRLPALVWIPFLRRWDREGKR